MGILSSISNALGFSDDDAPKEAAATQLAATEKNIAFQEESRDLARADLAPFAEQGVSALDRVSGLISDPNKQLDFIQDNPFFKFLADDAQSRLFNNQAARGKVGTGGTALALQNSQMLLGDQLVGNQVGRELSIANLGQASAAGQAAQTNASAGRVGESILGGGNATAAGIMGASNANTQGAGSVANLGLGIGSIVALSDRNEKTDIKKIGNIGFPVYFFKYKGSDKLEIGGMAQDGILPTRKIGGKLYVDYGAV